MARELFIVSTESWRNLEKSYNPAKRKLSLVLHEYFSLIGIDASDYYVASDEFIRLVEDEDYDISRIADSSPLPSPSSLRIREVENSELDKGKKLEIQSKLTQLGYDIVDGSENARYEFKLNISCKGFITKTCSSYLEMVDSYKNINKVAHEKFEIEKAIGKKNAINDLLNSTFRDFPFFQTVKDPNLKSEKAFLREGLFFECHLVFTCSKTLFSFETFCWPRLWLTFLGPVRTFVSLREQRAWGGPPTSCEDLSYREIFFIFH